MEKNENVKGDEECWYTCVIFKRAAREGHIDKVTFGKGNEGGEGVSLGFPGGTIMGRSEK